MDSDESRPGSSASNSSDSSNNSDNSRPSSPVEPQRKPSQEEDPEPEPQSRASSRSSSRHSAKSKSDSGSSSSSSDNEDDETANIRNKRSSRSSSEESADKNKGTVSRNQSISPVRKSARSSRTSSVSSNRSTGQREDGALNMSHEDLSDVSDLESDKRDNSKHSVHDNDDGEVEEEHQPEEQLKSTEDTNANNDDDDEENSDDAGITDLRQKLDQRKNQLKAMEGAKEIVNGKSNGNVPEDIDDLVKEHDEDALDFEAEEGECQELSKDDEQTEKTITAKGDNKSDGEAEEGEELEEGEVSDEDDKRPEETEPKPVCRFYTRGQCTWGMSCRFLHPGVTDKGNYTMFDMVRPVPLPHAGGGGGGRQSSFAADPYHDFRTERPPLHHRPPMHHHAPAYAAHHEARAAAVPDTPLAESAWERGLRTAKEMMRKANKRKEQDMDFEDKKMNLTLSPDELEKDNYYIKDRASPSEVPPVYPPSRHPPAAYHDPGMYSPPDRYARAMLPPYEEVDPYGRTTRYRELPPHRMPQYEDDRRVRPAREVIVQRVETAGRGDEWSDPWMRSKSPGRGGERDRLDKRRRDRSYSSNSSYTSSSSSQSDSSSESSRSSSPTRPRRYNSGSHKSPVPRRHIRTGARSPSPRRHRSPSFRRSPPIPKRRGHMSPSPLPDKRVYSPGGKRRKISTPPRKPSVDKRKTKRRHRSSSSGSSGSSGSESDSSGSSSTGSSSRSRGNTPAKRNRALDKATDRKPAKKVEVKKRSPISIELKKQSNVIGASALTSPTNSNASSTAATSGSKKATRREELLKQLRAVEDAIAKKRSKLT